LKPNLNQQYSLSVNPSKIEDLGTWGLLNWDVKREIMEHLYNELDDDQVQRVVCTLRLVCKDFYNLAKQFEHERDKVGSVYNFDPCEMGSAGPVTLPFPHWDCSNMLNLYADKPWISSLSQYVEEMKLRQGKRVSLQRIFLFSDAPLHKMRVRVFIGKKRVANESLVDARSDFTLQTTESPLYKDAMHPTRLKAPEFDHWLFDLVFNDRYNRNRVRQRWHNEHVEYVRTHRNEIIENAEENDFLLNKIKGADAVTCAPIGANYAWKDTYGDGSFKLEFVYDGMAIGCVSVSLIVLGWFTSTFRTNVDPIVNLHWATGLDQEGYKCHPKLIGARFKVVVLGLQKEIH